MIWKVLSSSVTGTSHASRNEPGQDYCLAGVRCIAERHFFIGIAADGAGCSSDGGTGARIACETLCRHIDDAVRQNEGCLDTIARQDIENWIASCRAAVGEQADKDGRQARDYACTLIGAVVGDDRAVFFQIGDGCIVTGDAGGYRTVFWPEQGEYANTTYFLTDEAVLNHLNVSLKDTAPDEIALLTDGLQNLVLCYPTKTVHGGFFRPLFDAIKNSPDDECRSLSEKFRTFLDRDEIRHRSDDDKTLILAVRTPAPP